MSFSQIVPLLLALGVGPDPKVPDTYSSDEWGISVSAPAGLDFCLGESGTHIHGVSVNLTGEGCQGTLKSTAIALWADYNAMFARDALEWIQMGIACGGTKPHWADGEWGGAVGGLKTAICRSETPSGRINIGLVAQRGQWGEGFNENAHLPKIFYSVSLSTTPERLDRDLKSFKEFLKSIRLREIN